MDGTKIEFVKLQTGSGIYTDEEKQTLQQRTAMKELKQEFGFSSAVAENNTLRLKAVINNNDLNEGYHITELGIIAKKEGDESEILYSIAIAEEADYLPSRESPVEIVQDYYTKISNAESVEINVQQGAYATAEDMQAVLYPNFTEVEERENITSGESIFTLFGKIRKWFSDLKSVAFSGSYHDLSDKPSIPSVVNNNTTTAAGYALDARQANPNIAGSLGAQINAANTALAAHKTSGDHDGRYYTKTEIEGKVGYNSTTVTSAFITTVRVCRQGDGMKRLRLVGAKSSLIAGTAYTVCTLPEEYRPQTGYQAFAVMAASTAAAYFSRVEITTAGVVTLTPYTARAAGESILIDVSYN